MYHYSSLPEHKFRGARALVLLHERYLRECIMVWKQAKAANVKLPKTDDPDYQSMDHLLHHILRAARGYMTWLCEKLGLPDPGIREAPKPETAAAEVDEFLEHVLKKWRTPLVSLTEEQSEQVYKSRWGTDYSIDAMLEHAVMHPIRHTFQMQEWLINASPLSKGG
jgi:uncharacterized damage-inducible protein DinB